MRLTRLPLFSATLALFVLPALTGCSRSAFPSPALDSSAQQRRQLDAIRQDLEQVPPPSKTRYMAVKSLDSWMNPYVTVQGSMLTLHVTLADANPSSLGVGGLLRPVGARRQDLNVRTVDLPSALNAVPPTAWPYGRVVAVEEAHNTPAQAEPQVRRNMELTVKTLGDVGVVVYDWQDNASNLR